MYILNEKIAEITVGDELGMDNEEIMQRQSQSIMMCYNFRGRGRVGGGETIRLSSRRTRIFIFGAVQRIPQRRSAVEAGKGSCTVIADIGQELSSRSPDKTTPAVNHFPRPRTL